jgi:hypothetical protein
MVNKAWNVRDETVENLEAMLVKKYKEIKAAYKMLSKLSKIEDAKKMMDEIWQMKSFANAIEVELMRREYNENGIS